MMKFIVGSLAFATMTGILLVQPALSRCFWNCTQIHHHHYARPMVFLTHPRANPGRREHEIGQGSSAAPDSAGQQRPVAAQKPQASKAHRPGRQDETKNEEH